MSEDSPKRACVRAPVAQERAHLGHKVLMCASEAREEVQDRDRAILRLRWNEHAKRHLALGRLALVREHFLLG